MSNLIEYALKKFDNNFSTRGIRKRLKQTEFTNKICKLMFKLCDEDMDKYNKAIKDFIDFSEEFFLLQLELERNGDYGFDSFKKTREEVYDNPKVMENRYL